MTTDDTRRGGRPGKRVNAETIVFAIYHYPRTYSAVETYGKYVLEAIVTRGRPNAPYKFGLDSLEGAIPRIVGDGRGPAGNARSDLRDAIDQALANKLECKPEDIYRLKLVRDWFLRSG